MTKGMARGSEDFHSRYDVDPITGCWNWMTSKGGNRRKVKAYGKWRSQPAHRAALEMKLGRPIADGLEACHTCDNAACVNFDHLYEGTHSDNIKDVAMRNLGWMKSKSTHRANRNRTPEKRKQVSDMMKTYHAAAARDKYCNCGAGPFKGQRALTNHQTRRHQQ